MLDTIFQKYDLFLIVMMRMTGFILFNPVFGRRNVPNTVKAAMALTLAVVIVSPMERDAELDKYTADIFVFMLLLVKEAVFGYLIGLIINIYFSVISMGGEIIDMQMGLSMSQLYDPGSNIQMPLTANFFNVELMLIFFMTRSHTTLIEMIRMSFEVSPVTSFSFNAAIAIGLMSLFAHIFVLSLKLAFPILAVELVTETGIGIIMRAVPSINVFVVGVQLKILVALIVLVTVCPFLARFFDGMMYEMNEYIYNALIFFAS